MIFLDKDHNMVYLKNIKQNCNLVSFDGYINNDHSKHFTMTVDLNDSSKSKSSIEKCYYTSEALLKVFYTFAEKGSLPKELVAASH